MAMDIEKTKEDLNSRIEEAERKMAASVGASLYKSGVGFTQDQLYTYGGRYDSVFNITLKYGSNSYQKYGEMITLSFVYTLKERNALEENVYALNEKPLANAMLLDTEHDAKVAEILFKEGIDPHDFSSMLVLPSTSENNTFTSKAKRTPDILEIPYDADNNINDNRLIYGLLKRQKANGVGLMPSSEAEYLAYKLLWEPEKLTNEEKSNVFNDKGQICNKSVAYYYLLGKEKEGILSNNEKEILEINKENRYHERIDMLRSTLDDMGLKLEKIVKNYPKQVGLLVEKTIGFHDISFNVTGKFPLYLDFKGFLHIYIRHTEGTNISSQFTNRDKFQLEEKDIFVVMDIVLNALNDEYQKFKENNPDKMFYRTGDMAYYYNGDYYNVAVNPNGSINTFYKGAGKKK